MKSVLVRWWSDCTANWKDKWNKVKKNKGKNEDGAFNIHLIQVRVEKSKAVEEARQMRSYADKMEVERDRLR